MLLKAPAIRIAARRWIWVKMLIILFSSGFRIAQAAGEYHAAMP